MNDLISDSVEILVAAGYAVQRIPAGNREALAFENSVCLGFVFAYDTADRLLREWADDSKGVISRYGLALRHAGEKAWNVYVVLISGGPKNETLQASLAELEEDLVGTRKIARDGVLSTADLRSALLPLLPIQSAPKLEAVDMPSEIRMRASDVDPKGVGAFLSTADESVVLQLLEETP
jgi:hypothetical protein